MKNIGGQRPIYGTYTFGLFPQVMKDGSEKL